MTNPRTIARRHDSIDAMRSINLLLAACAIACLLAAAAASLLR